MSSERYLYAMPPTLKRRVITSLSGLIKVDSKPGKHLGAILIAVLHAISSKAVSK